MALGWSMDRALDTPMPFCALAIRGRAEMLCDFGRYIATLFFGPPPSEDDPPKDVAAQVNAVFGRMMGEK